MMVAVRTPLRVSLFGGGTDYPAYFRREPGAVLGFTIDKYIYLSALRLTASVDYRYRLSYSRVENVDSVAAIQHPVVRAVLEHYGFDEPTDFSVQSDLPAAAGLGSSSAFTVSVINLVSHLTGTPRTRMELAREAIHTEQALLQENVGVQDQLHASFGGINRFDLHGDAFRIAPVNIAGRDLKVLADWMVLVYTGVKRRATAVAAEQVKSTQAGALDAELREMMAFVDAAQQILEDTGRRADAPARIGALLHQSWQVKKRLSPKISAPDGGAARAPRRLRGGDRRAAMRPFRDRLPRHRAAALLGPDPPAVIGFAAAWSPKHCRRRPPSVWCRPPARPASPLAARPRTPHMTIPRAC